MFSSTIWGVMALAILVDAQAVSRTARCGPQFGLTCQGSQWGNCCSQYNYCGSTTDYCGTGCQNQWGTCNAESSPARSLTTLPRSSTVQSSSAAASPTLKVTTDARCGKGFGSTCKGSQWGDCCSQYSYCGSTANYCGTGCQQGFGTCNPVVSSIRSSSRSSTRSSSSTVGSSSSSLRPSSMPSSSSVARGPVSSSIASSSVASSSVASSSVASSSIASSSSVASSSVIASLSSSSGVSSTASSSAALSSSTVTMPTTTSATPSVISPAPCMECCSNGVKGLYVTSGTGLMCLNYNLAVLICGAIPTTTAC